MEAARKIHQLLDDESHEERHKPSNWAIQVDPVPKLTSSKFHEHEEDYVADHKRHQPRAVHDHQQRRGQRFHQNVANGDDEHRQEGKHALGLDRDANG